MGKPPGDEAGLKPDDVPICVVFSLKDPLGGDKVFAGGQIDELPGAILHQGVVLLLDRRFPFFAIYGMVDGFVVALWLDGG